MLVRAFMVLLSGAIGLTLTGCSTNSTILRGQSPQATPVSVDGGAGTHSCPMCEANGAISGHGTPYAPHGAACAPGCNLPLHPVHRNFQTYSTPPGLMYPQDETPAATVQYPYYTLRGPTDFFME